MLLEKDVIREAVKNEWDKLLKFINDFVPDAEEIKIQRARWVVLDNLWNSLYDEEY